jgi:hypothetical protein
MKNSTTYQPRGLLEMALDEWYRRTSPWQPQDRAHAIAAEFGVSPTLLFKYTQLDFNRRSDSY